MSTQTPAAPAAPPKSTSEQFADAMREFEAAPEKTTPAAPPAPVPAEPEKKVEAAPAEPEKKPEPVPEGVPDRIKQSFEKLAVERSAFRKEQEAVKPYTEALKVLNPTQAQALSKALSAKDPLAALTALGYSYADVASRVVDMGAPAPKKGEAPKEAPAQDPEVAELKKELAEVKAWRAEQQKQQVLTRITDAVKDKPLITKLGEQNLVLDYLTDFHARTGRTPGDTFEESVAVAAEAVEQHLAAQAKRFAGLAPAQEVSKELTPPAPSGSVQGGASAVPAGQGTSGKTITNADVAPRTVSNTPKSREDLLKDLATDPNWPA